MRGKPKPEQLAGVAMVLALHALAFYGLWSYRLLPTRAEASTLLVNFIAPPAVTPPPPKREPPRPQPLAPPQPRQLVAQAPVIAPGELVAPPPPPPAPAIEAPPAPPPRPVGPVTLNAELAVACPERTPPAYPPLSRRLGETGTVLLRVELDEHGRVATARVDSGSGYERLDQAALAAVKTWRCQPPLRDGLAQRAVARQPFKFVLQGS